MFAFLTKEKERWARFSVIFLFALLRVISFFTYEVPILNQIIGATLVGLFIFFCFKKFSFAWIILLAELVLNGAGHFFEIHGLILRTWFLGIFGLFYLIQKIRERKLTLPVQHFFFWQILAVITVILLAVVHGFIKNNTTLYILQDAILYFFLFLLFPASEFLSQNKKYLPTLLKGFIIGSSIFSLFSFLYYSTGVGTLRDTYYHWFRNVAGGKITDLGDNFFRIVLSEHLFIVPIFLVLTSLLIHDRKNKKLWFLLTATSIVLVLNFSRIYFVALAVGMIILAIKNSFKKWFMVSAVATTCVLMLFSSFYLFASRGNSLGLELLGLRIGGTTNPSSETSGAIRLAILPKAVEKIKNHPWIGSGLGTIITYTDPATKQEVTRTQFDWGYHEVLAELGILGSFIFLFFLTSIIFSLGKIIYTSGVALQDPDLPLLRGLFAGALSLFVINITTPALFQGFGILYFVLLLILIQPYTKKKIQIR